MGTDGMRKEMAEMNRKLDALDALQRIQDNTDRLPRRTTTDLGDRIMVQEGHNITYITK
jgi:hypothetical protein